MSLSPKATPSGETQPQKHPDKLLVEASFIGPLPPPGLLKGYEEVHPGAAERIIAMAEKQSEHRRQMEAKAVDTSGEAMRLEFMEARRGQICAVVIALAFIAAGVWIATNGHPWQGAVLGGGGVGLQALVATFVRGRYRPADQSQELGQKGSKQRSKRPQK